MHVMPPVRPVRTQPTASPAQTATSGASSTEVSVKPAQLAVQHVMQPIHAIVVSVTTISSRATVYPVQLTAVHAAMGRRALLVRLGSLSQISVFCARIRPIKVLLGVRPALGPITSSPAHSAMTPTSSLQLEHANCVQVTLLGLSAAVTKTLQLNAKTITALLSP